MGRDGELTGSKETLDLDVQATACGSVRWKLQIWSGYTQVPSSGSCF